MVIRFRLMWMAIIFPVILVAQIATRGLFPIQVPLWSCIIVGGFAVATWFVVERSHSEVLLHAVTFGAVAADMYVIFLNSADRANATDRGAYLGLVLVIIEAATFWKLPGGFIAGAASAIVAYLRVTPNAAANEPIAIAFRSSALIIIGVVIATVVSSLERARGALQRQVKSMQATSRFGSDLAGADVVEVAERVADVLVGPLEFERVFVAIVEGPASAYVSRGANAPEPVEVNVRWDLTIEFVDHTIVIRPDDRLIPLEMRGIIPLEGALVIAPIRVRDHRFGIVSVATRESGVALAATKRMLTSLAVECGQFLEQDRLKRLANDTIEELRQVALAKDDFLAVASHELRTPITALRGFVRALDHRATLSDEEYSNAVAAINRQVRRVQQLIEHLLTASTIDAGRIVPVPERVSLSQVVSEVLSELEPIASRITFSVSIPDECDQLECDGSFLRRILTNLISNAITYSPNGGSVRVAAAPEHLAGSVDAIAISVADDGIGIAHADLPRLFSRFERLAADQGRGGSGLGLYIVNGLVRSMGGTVGATSILGRGSTLRVVLPREYDEALVRAPLLESEPADSHYDPRGGVEAEWAGLGARNLRSD